MDEIQFGFKIQHRDLSEITGMKFRYFFLKYSIEICLKSQGRNSDIFEMQRKDLSEITGTNFRYF